MGERGKKSAVIPFKSSLFEKKWEAWPDALLNSGVVQKKNVAPGRLQLTAKSLTPNSLVVRLTHVPRATFAVNCNHRTSRSLDRHRENCSRLQSDKSSLQSTANGWGPCCRTRRRRLAVRTPPPIPSPLSSLEAALSGLK